MHGKAQIRGASGKFKGPTEEVEWLAEGGVYEEFGCDEK